MMISCKMNKFYVFGGILKEALVGEVKEDEMDGLREEQLQKDTRQKTIEK